VGVPEFNCSRLVAFVSRHVVMHVEILRWRAVANQFFLACFLPVREFEIVFI
jgi:hypothetical protein